MIEKLKKIDFKELTPKKTISAIKKIALAFFVIALIYLLFLQSDRYLSLAKIIVNQSHFSEAGSNGFSNIVTAQRSKSEDMQLIVEYIKSVEMMEYLDYSIDLRKIYSSKKADIFSGLSAKTDKDKLYKFYLKHINVKTSPDNSIIIIEVQSFRPEDSRKILEVVIRRSEEFINKIFHDVAKEQLDFIKDEVFAKEKRILEFEKKLRKSQRESYSADSKIVNNSLQRKLDFAIQAHKGSLETLEAVRAESAQNLKKLVVITGPTVEEDASYPKRTYNAILFISVFVFIFLIIRSTYVTILTHKSMK